MFTAEKLGGFIRTLEVASLSLPAAQGKAAIQRVAIAERDRVLAEQKARSGLAPTYRQIVDGVLGAPLDAAEATSTVVFVWQYHLEVVRDTLQALISRSPVLSGNYVRSIILLVDGTQAELGPNGEIEGAGIGAETREVVIVATADYARRLEVGKRKDGSPVVRQVAPHIVEETAIVARRLFGTVATITFAYVEISNPYVLKRASSHRRVRGRLVTEMTYPAIRISPRIA